MTTTTMAASKMSKGCVRRCWIVIKRGSKLTEPDLRSNDRAVPPVRELNEAVDGADDEQHGRDAQADDGELERGREDAARKGFFLSENL